MVSVLVHTTLIRDQNGLGFSIAGGEGSPSFKDSSDVRTSLTLSSVYIESPDVLISLQIQFQAIYISRITDGGVAQKDGKLLVGDKVISVSLFLTV